MHGEDQQREIRPLGDDIFDQLNPVGPLQRDIDHSDVRFGFRDGRHGFSGVSGLGTDHEVRFTVEELDQSLAHNRMVVNNQDSCFGF